jgi:cytochrome c553
MVKVPGESGTVAGGRCWLDVRVLPLLLLLPLAACAPPSNETGAAFTRTGEIIAMGGGEGGPANACFSCHGLDGAGDGVSVPRLAGLDAGYLQKQMEDYAKDVRQDGVMREVARWLDDGDRRAVAQFYADMPAPAARGTVGPPPKLYLTGDPSRSIASCAACHGADGLGVGFGNPAIAGQPAGYTVDQLDRWQDRKRRNDPRGVMTDAVRTLTDAEIAQIAAWLERAPAARPPDTAVASASVAASAAARPEASRGVRRPDR